MRLCKSTGVVAARTATGCFVKCDGGLVRARGALALARGAMGGAARAQRDRMSGV